jgi:hypothetical protein
MIDGHGGQDGSSVSLLQALGLTPLQLQALARQGFVACESRDTHGPYFKLRFRVGGRHVVRGLGRDPDFAAQVESAILELQKRRRRELEMSRLVAEAAQMLRTATKVLREPLAECGFHFHGLAIRRTRVDRSTANARRVRA